MSQDPNQTNPDNLPSSPGENAGKPLGEINEKYKQYFKRLTRLGAGDVITRPNCKFCNHPARKEGEEEFEKYGSYAAVERFFEKYHQSHPEAPLMNFRNIRSHIENHFYQQQKKQRMAEYCDWLTEVMSEKRAKEEMFGILCESAKMKYMEVVSNNALEPSRQVDAMVKLGKLVLDVAKYEAEIRGDLKPVNILIDKVTNVWHHAIKDEEDPKVQRRLLEVLDIFQTEVEGAGIGEKE